VLTELTRKHIDGNESLARNQEDILHPLILLAILVDKAKGENGIRISSIQNDNGNAGKAFNLDIISLWWKMPTGL